MLGQRRGPFGHALRNLKPQRDRMVLVLQSYTRAAALMGAVLSPLWYLATAASLGLAGLQLATT